MVSPDPQQWCPGFVTLSFLLAQANNQWNIAAELADDPMDSAFARALRGGIKGVAMVLDHEVQPLTRASTAQGKEHINKSGPAIDMPRTKIELFLLHPKHSLFLPIRIQRVFGLNIPHKSCESTLTYPCKDQVARCDA